LLNSRTQLGKEQMPGDVWDRSTHPAGLPGHSNVAKRPRQIGVALKKGNVAYPPAGPACGGNLRQANRLRVEFRPKPPAERRLRLG